MQGFPRETITEIKAHRRHGAFEKNIQTPVFRPDVDSAEVFEYIFDYSVVYSRLYLLLATRKCFVRVLISSAIFAS